MCRQGDFLDGVPNPFLGRKARWTFVSAFYFLFLVISLTHYHSQSVGRTPDGQDFEAFIGTEKAKEFRVLFSNWVHTIYREL